MKNRQAAFSLVEVVIALGVVAFAVVTLVGVLVPIQEGVRDDNLTATASRLQKVVEQKLRESEESLISQVDAGSALVVVYQVRVRADFDFREDPKKGDLHPSFDGGIGTGYQLAPVVRRAWNSGESQSWIDDEGAMEGTPFLVDIRAENADRLQPEKLSGLTEPQVRVLNCYWYPISVGYPQESWSSLVNRRAIMKTPLVLRP